MPDERFSNQDEHFDSNAEQPIESARPETPPAPQNTEPRHYGNPYGQYTPYQQKPPQPPEYQWNFDEYAAAGRKKKASGSKGLTIFVSMLAVVLAIGVLWLSGYGVYSLVTRDADSDTPDLSLPEQSQGNVAQIIIKDKPDDPTQALVQQAGGYSTVDIAKKVRPSVVGITQYSSYDSFTPSGGGSGIIISSDGYIVTNAHVVVGAIGMNVELYNGESYAAQLIGYDTRTDLAVIKIAAENLTYAEFGDSTKLEVGERVVAIGNPGGQLLAGSVTQGIVSGLDRMIKDGGYSLNYIQVDAAINPGNSGGALVNEYGQVVGINSAKIASVEYEGIGFAIPVHEAKSVIDDLMTSGYVTGRTKIGISGEELNDVVAQINGLPAGILIRVVESSSDLATKNVSPGDIITHIDGERVKTFDEIAGHLKGKSPGDTIKISLYRPARMGNGKQFDVTVKLMADTDKPADKAK